MNGSVGSIRGSKSRPRLCTWPSHMSSNTSALPTKSSTSMTCLVQYASWLPLNSTKSIFLRSNRSLGRLTFSSLKIKSFKLNKNYLKFSGFRSVLKRIVTPLCMNFSNFSHRKKEKMHKNCCFWPFQTLKPCNLGNITWVLALSICSSQKLSRKTFQSIEIRWKRLHL